MKISERHFYRASGDTTTRTSKTKFFRHVGAVLLGLAIVLACSASAKAQQTIWPSTIVPATIDSGSSGSVELGVLFKADTNGTISAIRFYKSAANTGVHVGHLWSHAGALLATVTFTRETASGWQQANFSTPVAIAANTEYVVSYQTSIGHWSVNWNYFATSGVNNPPLHALQNGSGTPDGVWGSAGAFPTSTNASNYWVDVVFSAAGVPPSITAQPVSQTVTAGQTATFSVAATGSAPLTYQWQKNGAAISGANSASYTTPATTTADNGAKFTVAIKNAAGSVTSSAASLSVNALLPTAAYAFNEGSGNTTADASGNGNTGTLSAPSWTTAGHYGNALSFNGANGYVEAANSNSFNPGTAATFSAWMMVLAANADVSSVVNKWSQSIDDEYLFGLNSSNHLTFAWQTTGGNVWGQPSYNMVSGNTQVPLSTWTYITVVRNGPAISFYINGNLDASFSAAADANPFRSGINTLRIGGQSRGSVSRVFNGTIDEVRIYNQALTQTQIQADMNAPIHTPAVPPSITTQPNSQTITAGQTATFSVTASGTAPLGYQWQKNGAAISGANSASYTTQATTTADNGAKFTALVSNSAGSVTSSAATLTVNAATYLVSASATSLSFGNVDIGSSSTLNTTVTNNGNSNVTISGVTVTGTGFSTSGVTSGTILAPNQSATLTVAFAPTAAQSVTGSVTVASNATNSPAKVTLAGVGIQPTSAAFPVWVAPSLVRVGKADAAGTASSISLSSARGETVDTQVVVQGPSSGLTNVNVSASALTGPGGATIPASSVTLYREYYVTVTGTANYGGGSNPPLGSGTYPEPLIPFNDPETGSPLCGTTATLKACNATVSAGQNQPYWIDISVPRGATNSPAGTYTGTISVTADQGNVSIPVTLTVWNFELPAQPSELSLWTLWPPAAGNTTTTLAQALMRNKVIGWYDVAANAATDITNFGLNRSGLDGYYYIGIQCNGSYSSIPSTSQINAAAANFPAGLGLDFYLADELNGCTGDYSAIKTMGANAHAANRSVKTMMTINTTDSNLYGAIDHWVLLDSVQQWPLLPFIGSGDLWSYTSCNAGFGNTPEWMVDYPPINERIQAGFLNWTQGATGILYYRSDGWTAGNAIGSWNNVDTTACGGGLGRPGDGIFLYPPAPIASTESAPGIRLKAIRDGIQDYEYAQILKSLGKVPFLNSIIVPIATSWTNWSHDPTALENARLQLGQQLHLLAP
jgi:hypothetical protein